MDQNLKKIIPFALKYKKNAILNVVFNVFYAFFSTILMVSLIPTLDVLFKQTEKVIKKPEYSGIADLSNFGQEYLAFYITKLNDDYGAKYALLLVVGIVIVTALLKNIFNYLASFQITILTAKKY
jgi:subfamily B ATP-binding cassette protein MsbA